MINTKAKRPALVYFGGKWGMAPWIIEHFPRHHVYVEVFGGGASVLIRKHPSPQEIINDLDDHIVNFFSVLRDPVAAEELVRILKLTPYSRREFQRSYDYDCDTIEAARRFAVRVMFSIGHGSSPWKCGFRNSSTMGSSPARQFKKWANSLPIIVDRLRDVTVDNLHFRDVLKKYDKPETLFYVDPPYPAEDVNTHNSYRHVMTNDEHAELSELLHGIKGMAVVSGLSRSTLYRTLYNDWTLVLRNSRTNSTKINAEALWLCPKSSAFGNQARMF